MSRFCFKKIFILFFLCSSLYVKAQGLNPRGSIALSTMMPLEKGQSLLDENSFYLSSFYYSIAISSYIPKSAQKFTGQWSIILGSSWIHGFPIKKNIFPSYYPALVNTGLQWQLDYFPLFITPVLGLGFEMKTPFQKEKTEDLLPESLQAQYFYTWRAAILLSFDILNRYFSKKMQHEYNIQDMGLYAEYRKYIAVETTSSYKTQGWGFGLFISF